jgi:hypothetical protein
MQLLNFSLEHLNLLIQMTDPRHRFLAVLGQAVFLVAYGFVFKILLPNHLKSSLNALELNG